MYLFKRKQFKQKQYKQWRCFFTFLFSALFLGCSEPQKEIAYQCPNEEYYSLDFLNSYFYRGWLVMQDEASFSECQSVLPYFHESIKQNSYLELSSLYSDHCAYPMVSSHIDRSSIYHGAHLTHKLSEDEFKWIVNLALCGGTVEQYALGKMLVDGFITEQDMEQGLYFLTNAAKNNHHQALLALINTLEMRGELDVAQQWRDKMKKMRAEYY